MSGSDADGRVCGGHVTPGCIVRTTAEIVVANLPGERYTREHDAATGFAELVIRAA
jgi:predicted DNA-binding protein with PD1-like motif